MNDRRRKRRGRRVLKASVGQPRRITSAKHGSDIQVFMKFRLGDIACAGCSCEDV